MNKIRKLLWEIFFPKYCLNCRQPGEYLCPDCLALIDFPLGPLRGFEFLSSLYFAADYKNFIVKNLIQKLKYQPFAKELAKDLSSIIITYLKNLEKQPEFLKNKEELIFLSIPLAFKKLKYRGFNQAEEIAKILAAYFNIPFLPNGLIKIKETTPQINLAENERKQNVKNVFSVTRPDLISGKKIILVDDVFTTGATMEEAAKILKKAGAKQVVGLTVAHG